MRRSTGPCSAGTGRHFLCGGSGSASSFLPLLRLLCLTPCTQGRLWKDLRKILRTGMAGRQPIRAVTAVNSWGKTNRVRQLYASPAPTPRLPTYPVKPGSGALGRRRTEGRGGSEEATSRGGEGSPSLPKPHPPSLASASRICLPVLCARNQAALPSGCI